MKVTATFENELIRNEFAPTLVHPFLMLFFLGEGPWFLSPEFLLIRVE
jgi:hypothetical protein